MKIIKINLKMFYCCLFTFFLIIKSCFSSEVNFPWEKIIKNLEIFERHFSNQKTNSAIRFAGEHYNDAILYLGTTTRQMKLFHKGNTFKTLDSGENNIFHIIVEQNDYESLDTIFKLKPSLMDIILPLLDQENSKGQKPIELLKLNKSLWNTIKHHMGRIASLHDALEENGEIQTYYGTIRKSDVPCNDIINSLIADLKKGQ